MAQVYWPREGAVDVATDPVIAVGVWNLNGRWRYTYTLSSSAGGVVALDAVRTLQSLVSVVLLRPRARLDPETVYEVRVDIEGRSPDAGAVTATAFTTGQGVRGSVAPPGVDFSLMELRMDAGSFLQLFASTTSTEPAWIVANGYVAGIGTATAPTELPLGAVDCADVEIVDMAGTTVRSDSLCMPTRCAWAEWYDSCTDNPAVHWEQWLNAPDGRCAGPTTPTTGTDAETSPSGSGAEPGAGTGCSLATETGISRSGAVAALLLLLATSRRRARRLTTAR